MQNIEKNIQKVYWYKILLSMFFSVPIMVLFWQKNGLNMTQIMLLQSFMSILVVALEIPTGYIADIFWRKKSLILSSLFFSIAISIYSISFTLWHFAVWEIFFALAVSFMSGTLSAFVYDTLLELKRENEFKKIWWNMTFYWMIALAISNILWWFIAYSGLRFTIYASIPFFVVSLFLSFSFVEPEKHKNIIKQNYLKNLIKIITENLVKNEKLRWIIIYSWVIYGFNQAAIWLYQPYFELSWINIMYFWIVFASFHIVAAFSSKYAYKIEEYFWQKTSLISLTFLVWISYLLMSNFVFLFSFSFAFLHQFIRWFRKIIIADYINKLTLSENRATILSVESFAWRIFYSLIIPIFWYITDIFSLIQALSILWITSIISGIIVLIFLKKNRVI